MKNPYKDFFIFTKKHFKFTITPKSQRFCPKQEKAADFFSDLTLSFIIYHLALQGDMNPRALVDEFRCFHVVAQEGVIAWNEGDIDGAAFGVVTVLCTSYGLVQCLAPETGVYPDGLTEVCPERFKHLLAELLEVVHFFRIDAVLDALLCRCLAAEHLF